MLTLPFPSPTRDPEPLTDEERAELQDAVDQDKELRWLERDASIAERALLGAAEGVTGAELQRLHRAHREAQARLAAAHESILAWLKPQFQKRRTARARGEEAVVMTREEFRQLSLEERDRLERAVGRDQARVAAELKAKARDILIGRGWQPRQAAAPTVGGRAPRVPSSAWGFRERLARLFDGAAG